MNVEHGPSAGPRWLYLHGFASGPESSDISASRRWARGKRHVRLVEVDDGHELVASIERIAAEADDFLRPSLAPVGA